MMRILTLFLLLISQCAYAFEKVELSTSLLGGVTHTRKGNHQRGIFGAEVAINNIHELIKPKIGYIQTTKQSKYLYSGFDINFQIPSTPIIIQPGFSIGAYDKGHCKDLGGTLEFQSAIGVMYQFNKQFSAGAVLSHISNAGIYKRNPGTEHVVAKLTYVW